MKRPTKKMRSDPVWIGETLASIAEAAALVILPYWRGELVVDSKADESPVTEADRQAELLILERLLEAFPDVPTVSEEAAHESGLPAEMAERFLLIDPLDGTRGFIQGREAFTVNIGLIERGEPVAGAVAAPASGLVWHTTAGGAVRRKLGETTTAPVKVRQRPTDGLALLSHTVNDADAERLAARNGCSRWQGMDSSVKFCLIAQGHADVYPRPGRTMEWDTAAADAVLRAAGGRTLTDDGQPLTYGKADKGFANPGFVAMGG